MHENPMTPMVTSDLLNNSVAGRKQYLAIIRDLQTNLQTIGVEARKVTPGTAEIGLLIPGELFKNHLAELIIELRSINRIIRAFSEIATGSPEPIEIRQISSTDPLFVFGISTATIVMVANVVKWALDTWKEVEKIRKIRAHAQKVTAFTDKDIKDMFDGKIQKSIKTAVRNKVDEMLPQDEKEAGRQHEQRTDLSWALESVLTRVERGMTVEIRFLPPPASDDDPETVNQFSALQQIVPQLAFPPPDATPILPLPPPEPPSSAAN